MYLKALNNRLIFLDSGVEFLDKNSTPESKKINLLFRASHLAQ